MEQLVVEPMDLSRHPEKILPFPHSTTNDLVQNTLNTSALLGSSLSHILRENLGFPESRTVDAFRGEETQESSTRRYVRSGLQYSTLSFLQRRFVLHSITEVFGTEITRLLAQSLLRQNLIGTNEDR